MLTEHLSVKMENDISTLFERPKDIGNPFYFLPEINLIRPLSEGMLKSKGSLVEIISNFDFTVVRCGIHLRLPTLALVDLDFVPDEERRLLNLKVIHCPIGSTYRCIKYAKKGYFLKTQECLKLFFDWETRPDEYKEEITTLINTEDMTEEQIDKLESLLRKFD